MDHFSIKTLIVSSWAPPMVGGPQNLYNLFSTINAESYAVLTSQRVLHASLSAGKIGSWLPGTYYAIEGGRIEKNSFTRKTQSGPKKPNRVANLVLYTPIIGKFVYNLAHAVLDISRYVASGLRVVKEQKFDQLLGVSDVGVSLISTWLIGKISHKPYSLYLYDLYLGNLLSPPFSWLAKILERPIMTNAKFVIVTNEITEAYYQKRYGAKITTAVVHNSIFDRQTKNDYHPAPPYTIVFTGNVYWAQEQAVMNIIAAMEKLSDLPVTLKLFVPNAPLSLKAATVGKSNIELGAASQDQMPAIQGAATLLFLPLAWDTKAPDIIATATPGKFTDYLDSGRPMLVHAPDYAYVSKYTKEHKLGLVVDTNSVDDLTTAIRNFLADPKKGRTYVDNALRIFAANHEATKNAAKLTSLLNLVE